MKKTLRVFATFLVEIIVAAIIFVAIALVAVGLSSFVIYLENKQVDHIIVFTMKVVEYLVFFLDVFLFIAFIVTSFVRTLREF